MRSCPWMIRSAVKPSEFYFDLKFFSFNALVGGKPIADMFKGL